MLSRKEMKQLGRQSLKKHYIMFLAVCLIAAFLGNEFTGSLKFVKTYSPTSEQVSPSGTVTVQKGIIDVTEDCLQAVQKRQERNQKK